jgi:hypothetical protein
VAREEIFISSNKINFIIDLTLWPSIYSREGYQLLRTIFILKIRAECAGVLLMIREIFELLDKVGPSWVAKLPYHVKGFILFFIAIHAIVLLGAIAFALKGSSKDTKPPFKDKIK